MTLPRTPETFADAATRVAGHLGYKVAARIVRRSERLVYKWAHPSSTATPSIEQALALDVAFQSAGGEGAPFHDAYNFQLGIRVAEQTACQRELLQEITVATREAGEGLAAALVITQPNSTPREKHWAFVQVDEAHTAIGAVKARLAKFLPFGAGPDAGKAGGSQ
ncbi:hypothetical protein [Sphingomonas aracearum]|uniref:Uncharacterized protein n=1 Tax=Sphingomonas aracearum TaxID=2283317 RepID=A0A369VXW2_9SPHN|nr:hypothetical protein [Sphingomonas aracearum]RDE04671.1 hypothetical protein DVW87_13855 [Sphingomonas aracearum]